MELWLEHPMMKPAMSNPALADRIRKIANDNLTIWERLGVGERVPIRRRFSGFPRSENRHC